MKGNAMKKLNNSMKKKRGCMYCADVVNVEQRNHCPYDECPYHELDGFDSYGQYLKKTNPLSVSKLMKALGKAGAQT